jgi:hypothetical protein
MNIYRHGDVLIKEVSVVKGDKLPHLTLAEGEVTGHSHKITDGIATLFKFDDALYLDIQSELATLSHEEHHALQLPRGQYEIIIQREYDDENEWRNVAD